MLVSKSLFPLMVVTLMVEIWSSVESISLSMLVGSLSFGPLTQSCGGGSSCVTVHLTVPAAF